MQATDHVTVQRRVLQVLAARFGDAALALPGDAELAMALPGYDSLAALEFITSVEEEFGIEVDFVADDVRYSFSMPDRITEYVTDRLEDMR